MEKPKQHHHTLINIILMENPQLLHPRRACSHQFSRICMLLELGSRGKSGKLERERGKGVL
jgi:hypothetical protein